jgi:hypothetical protein
LTKNNIRINFEQVHIQGVFMKKAWVGLLVSVLGCGSVRQEEGTTQEKPKTAEETMEVGGVLRMSWFGPGHKAMEVQLRDRQCRSPYEFRSLQYGESLWVACEPDDRFHGGVITKLDPNKKEAQSYWAFPQILPLDRIVGFAPAPNEQLAILYQIKGAQNKNILALGLTGPEGWALAPLELGSFQHILGMSWNNNAVEIVTIKETRNESAFERSAEAPALISIITIKPDGARSERSTNITCQGEPCNIKAAYRRSNESAWRILVDKESLGIAEFTEDGTSTPSAIKSLDDVELSASGLLGRDYRVKATLEPNGTTTTHPEAPRGVENEAFESHTSRFRIEGEHLRTYCLWEMVGSRATLQNINGRMLYTDLIKSSGMLAITDATNPSQPKEKQVGPIAGKIFKWRCTDLQEGTFVPQKQGGYWLVGENGCFVPLSGVW